MAKKLTKTLANRHIKLGGGGEMVDWNNRKTRTQPQVLSRIDAAIRRVQKAGGGK